MRIEYYGRHNIYFDNNRPIAVISYSETREGKNAERMYEQLTKLGWKVSDESEMMVVELFDMYNYHELVSDYKEVKMKKILSSYEEDYAYDYTGSKYSVILYISEDNFQRKETNNIRTAISYWFQMEPKSRTYCCITCRKKQDACELIDWANDNKEFIEQLYNKYNVSYKLDYLLKAIEKEHNNRCKYFHEGVGDQIYPFCLG